MSARTSLAYLSISGFCLLVTNGALIAADRVGIILWLAVLLAFAVVASAGYLLHAMFTFKQPLGFKRFARYAVAMSANIPLTFVTTWFWHIAMGLDMTLAAPLATGCMLALNFALGRWAILAPKSPVAQPR